MSKKISMLDVKSALLDPRFQEVLPESLIPDLKKFLDRPGCACNHPIYRKVMREAGEQLATYFPSKEPLKEEDLDDKLMKNNFTIINCAVTELQGRLSKLAPGRKQIEAARWQDQVTVIVNDLDYV